MVENPSKDGSYWTIFAGIDKVGPPRKVTILVVEGTLVKTTDGYVLSFSDLYPNREVAEKAYYKGAISEYTKHCDNARRVLEDMIIYISEKLNGH